MAEQDPYLKLFCDNCGTLIKITTMGEIKCPLCQNANFDSNRLNLFEREVNLIPAETERENTQAEEGIRTTIAEKCPSCGHVGLYFTTAQLRSADEGQTIFYECPECHYRYQQNA